LEKLPPSFIAESDVIWHVVFLWSVGSAVLVVPPPSLLPIYRQPTCWGTQWKNRGGLDAV